MMLYRSLLHLMNVMYLVNGGMMAIDWSQAPAWAQYHAFDKNGNGYWYEQTPAAEAKENWLPKEPSWMATSHYIKPAGVDWRETLEERPKGE